MSLSQLPEYVVIIIEIAIVMFSAVLHELAHGYAALYCGDHTAKNAGRLSLNPLKHLDPFGSVLLPIAMAFLHGPIFGYAKPVPVDPRQFAHPKKDTLLVSLAGPCSNILQALVGALIFRVLPAFNPLLAVQAGWVFEILYLYVMVNLVLCFFNLLPIPPLDGSHIIAFFLNGKALYTYYQFQRYSMILLLVLLYLLPMVFRIDPLGWYFAHTADALTNIFLFGRAI